MTTNDMDYICTVLDDVWEPLETAIGNVEIIQLHIESGDIVPPNMDKACLKAIHDNLVNAHTMMQAYWTELKARQQE